MNTVMPQPNFLIIEAARYVEELNWRLTFIHGIGPKMKAPYYLGWPDFLPDVDQVRNFLQFNADAGVGINLGASDLPDVEADTPEGEQLLDDLCGNETFPCWQARRGKHRLFQA